MRKYIWLGLKLFLVVFVMIWILRNADTALVFAAMAQSNLWLIAVAVGMQVLGAAIMAARWNLLLEIRDVRPGFGYLFTATVSAFFFRQFLPSVVGGDAIRSVAAWQAGADPGFAALSLVADRLFGLLALILFLIVASVSMIQIAGDLPGLWAGIGAAIAVVGGGLVFLVAPGKLRLPARAPARLHSILDAMRVFAGAQRIVPACLGLSVLLQINVVTFYWVIGQSLGLDVPYAAFYVIVPIAIFSMMAPFSINGIGIREVAFIYLLGIWNVDSELALAFAWLEFAAILTAGLIGGVVYLLHRSPQKAVAATSCPKGVSDAT